MSLQQQQLRPRAHVEYPVTSNRSISQLRIEMSSAVRLWIGLGRSPGLPARALDRMVARHIARLEMPSATR